MNIVEVLNVKLQRNDQTVSWGFNVQGGKEFHCPLIIQKVNPNSLADRCSIQPGDFILKVGTMSTEHLTHNQARDAIIRQGNNLELTLQRGAPPRPDDYQARLDFPQHQLMNPESIQQKQTLSPQVGVQLGKNKALLTQSYNSPMGLYSSQNIADTLVTSMKNMNVNDQTILQAAQTFVPKPYIIKSVSNVHTPTSHTNVTSVSFSKINPNLHANKHFSVPEFVPVRPAPAPAQPGTPYNPYQNQPSLRPFSNAASAASPVPAHQPAPAPAPAPRPNGNRVIGSNRGAIGSHLLNMANPNHVPTCNGCTQLIRGPFISAIGKIFCPHHFVCAHQACGVNLETCGFVEEDGKLYCEKCFELYFAPSCFKCKSTILGECVSALERSFHPECFVCAKCKQKIGSGKFHMEDGLPYCPKDFNALFSQKCAGCDFPIEAGDQFFEAINQLWHCECFTCSTCHVQLKASGFCVKGVKPYCKKHAF